MESEVKILCDNHKACPEVMDVLEDMDFTRVRDISNSSVSFDITAKRNFRDEQDEQKTIEKVFDRCKGKVNQIEVTRKN